MELMNRPPSEREARRAQAGRDELASRSVGSASWRETVPGALQQATQEVLIHRSGERYAIEYTASAIRNADGTAAGCVLVFLLVSPVSKLVLPQPGGTVDANAPGVRINPEHPVVMILLDELPTTSLLDSKGRMDQRLYPNFAKLAGHSTWYRNATGVSDISSTPASPDDIEAIDVSTVAPATVTVTSVPGCVFGSPAGVIVAVTVTCWPITGWDGVGHLATVDGGADDPDRRLGRPGSRLRTGPRGPVPAGTPRCRRTGRHARCAAADWPPSG